MPCLWPRPSRACLLSTNRVSLSLHARLIGGPATPAQWRQARDVRSRRECFCPPWLWPASPLVLRVSVEVAFGVEIIGEKLMRPPQEAHEFVDFVLIEPHGAAPLSPDASASERMHSAFPRSDWRNGRSAFLACVLRPPSPRLSVVTCQRMRAGIRDRARDAGEAYAERRGGGRVPKQVEQRRARLLSRTPRFGLWSALLALASRDAPCRRPSSMTAK